MRAIRRLSTFAAMGFLVGFLIWFAVFIFQGFYSEFGNRLTHLYGKDLTARNTDWQYLALITVAVTMVAFGFAGAAAKLFERAFVVRSEGGVWARAIRMSLFAIIVGGSVATLFYRIATIIGVSPAPPVLVATLAAGLSTFGVAKLSGPQIETTPNRTSD